MQYLLARSALRDVMIPLQGRGIPLRPRAV
jgi:hypothetical protein